MTVDAVPLAVAVERAVRGEYPDAKTIIGLLLAEKRLKEREP
jgi:hypothetical protein